MGSNHSILPGLLQGKQPCPPNLTGSRFAIISNDTVAKHYLDAITRFLPANKTDVIMLPDGEQHKNLTEYQAIIDQLIHCGLDRDSTIINLGGGVITDMGGFVAATYLRGIRCIHVPTTLLSQVDACIGNKTAINHPLGKNQIGAFYQANAIWIDPSCLNTLEPRQFNNGMAEVIKAACIADKSFFHWLSKHLVALQQHTPDLLTQMIERAIAIKCKFVAIDPTEQNQRRLLNFGHSIGHALEAAGNYTTWLHGEAVSIGMALSSKLSMKRGWLTPNELNQITRTLNDWQLPTALPHEITTNSLKKHMLRDKKMSQTQIKMILLKSLGEATSCPMGLDDLISELGRD